MLTSNNLIINNKNDLTYITFPSLAVDGVKHAFTTKLGGKSKGIFSTMNMSFTRGDDPNDVLENYKIICDAIGTDYKKCVLSKQTHTTNIHIVKEQDIGNGIITDNKFEDIDGLITDIPGVTLVTQFADCVGILLYDPKNRVIAASHAGWKGTANMIAKKTVDKMKDCFGCEPKNILAAIAPSIGPCCFEVDRPVYEQFMSIDAIKIDDFIEKKNNDKFYINLWEINRRSLILAGIDPDNISVTDLCTKCHHDIFFSHRYTNGKRGNLAALICLDEV